MPSVGRAVWHNKTTTESCCRLDMTNLVRRVRFDIPQWLPASWSSNWGKYDSIGIDVIPPDRLKLRYTSTSHSTGETTNFDYNVFIESTPCHYGGKRWWFLCPSCHRRCRVLYLAPVSAFFICRICGNLTYESQQEDKSMWWNMRKAIACGSWLEDRFCRSRSPRKRAILKRKLDRMYSGMQSIINWGKKHK